MRMNAKSLIWMNQISIFADGEANYPGFIEYSNTPSRFGTVPGFEGVLPLSHHKRHVSPTFGPVAALPVSGDHVAVFFNAANVGKPGSAGPVQRQALLQEMGTKRGGMKP